MKRTLTFVSLRFCFIWVRLKSCLPAVIWPYWVRKYPHLDRKSDHKVTEKLRRMMIKIISYLSKQLLMKRTLAFVSLRFRLISVRLKSCLPAVIWPYCDRKSAHLDRKSAKLELMWSNSALSRERSNSSSLFSSISLALRREFSDIFEYFV